MTAFRSESVEQTQQIGEAVARLCRASEGEVIALDGELGAGKTQFVRGMAAALGIDPLKISSPTFVLVHEYEGGRSPLVHIDAYRMHSAGELEELGFDELRRGAVVAVEWAARVTGALGEDRLEIFLEHAGGDHRLVTFTAYGSWRERAKQLAVMKCPICDKATMPVLEPFPFCSNRCRQIDLGRWLNEDYRVSRPIEQKDLEEGE